MDIEKEFNDWFYKSELAKVFTSVGDVSCMKYAFEKGFDRANEIIYHKLDREYDSQCDYADYKDELKQET